MPKKITSGLRSLYRVEMVGGEVLELQTELSDVMRWESQHNGAAWLTFPMPLSRQMWVAWRAARRLKLTEVKDPDSFLDQIHEFEDVTPTGDGDQDDDEAGERDEDPTPPPPSD